MGKYTTVKTLDPDRDDKKLPEEKTEFEEVSKVIRGSATKVKTSAIKRLFKGIFEEDAREIKGHIMEEVILPALRNMIFDAGRDALHMFLFKSTDDYDCGRGGRVYSFDYTGRSRRRRKSRDWDWDDDDDDDFEIKRRKRIRDKDYEFDDVKLETIGDCKLVIDKLDYMLNKFGMVTVSQLNSMIGCDDRYTDQRYGWEKDDEPVFKFKHTREGYFLDLPRPKYLE